jgi:hypothetical protein
MQPDRKPSVFLSFAGADTKWVARFAKLAEFDKVLGAVDVYNYVAKPELAGRLDHSIKDKVKSADIFFAFLSSFYLPARAEEGRRLPLTLIEFDLALTRLVDSAGKLPLLGLVVLDDTGRCWWENGCAEEDILNLVGEQAYLYAKHETKG